MAEAMPRERLRARGRRCPRTMADAKRQALLQGGSLMSAMLELAQCGAVILRTMEMLENEIEEKEP